MESHEIELDGKMHPSMSIGINGNFHDSAINQAEYRKYRTVEKLLIEA